MKRGKKLLIGLGAVITVAWTVAHVMTPTEAALPKHIRPVAVVLAEPQDLTRTLTLSAEFRPYEEADLHAKVAGYLKNITVDIGDQVKKGQVIATLDIDELKDDLAHATAAYHDAKLDYDRVETVIRKRPGLLAQADVDNAKAAYEMAKANMARAQTILDYATITAPFSGIITKRYVDPGALIQSSDNSSTQTLPIVHLAEDKKLRLDFPVPEAAVPDVHPGTKVTVTVQATRQVIQGVVARDAGKIDNSTRTMETEVDVDNKDLRITPGMYASVSIALEQKDNVLAVPVQAVSGGDKPNVWVVNAKNTIEEKPVTLGLETPNDVQVTAGLKPGERVVFGSRGALSVGMKVQPKPMKGT